MPHTHHYKIVMSYYTSYADVDVSQWVTCDQRYSFEDICAKLDIDTNNEYMRFLMNIDLLTEQVVDEPHLDLMGIRGNTFDAKQRNFRKLLDANADISYRRVRDRLDKRRNYYVVHAWDFETLFRQVEGNAADEFRRQSKRLRYAFTKYWEYKELYQRQCSCDSGDNNKV